MADTPQHALTDGKPGKGRPHRQPISPDALLSQRATVTLAELCTILGMDRTTVLRKEANDLLPPRRMIAGRAVFMSSDVRKLLDDAPVAIIDPVRSKRSTDIANARVEKAKARAAVADVRKGAA